MAARKGGPFNPYHAGTSFYRVILSIMNISNRNSEEKYLYSEEIMKEEEFVMNHVINEIVSVEFL